ncbi:MAG: two component transcriptional regulator, LuxR family [Bryobacterales bacterium]|nr:two component transcriptional regulator, LuxR family [Bryobacterales bacterium]
MPIRVLLADDHTILRQGLKRILEAAPDFEVVAEASSGVEAVQFCNRLQPDVVIMDIAMKELNGIEATSQLLRTNPAIAVLILSMYSDEPYVIKATKAGARGYLLKDSVEGELLQAVRVVHSGQSFFSPLIAKILLEGYARELNGREIEDRYELLTARERQVYQLLAEGRGNKDIAGMLGLSVHTVETHRIRIMEKMDVHSAAELVLSAVRRGLVR